MATQEEVIHEGIASMLQVPQRDFNEDPLTQEEIQAVMNQAVIEMADPDLDESLREFYFNIIKFLKMKYLYN